MTVIIYKRGKAKDIVFNAETISDVRKNFLLYLSFMGFDKKQSKLIFVKTYDLLKFLLDYRKKHGGIKSLDSQMRLEGLEGVEIRSIL